MVGHERAVTPISASLDVLRRQFGLGRPDALATLGAEWERLAGPDLAASSVVVDLRNGTVTVDATDPATAEVIGWSKRRLLEGLRGVCPDERIVDLTVRVRRR